MITDNAATTKDLIQAFHALRKTDPDLANFYRNQQRFLHIYALARGAEITAAAITELVQALDPSRTFGTRTYYQLRRDLEDDGWIETVTQTSGRGENPHRIKPERRNEYLQETIRGSLVDRPVVLNKYRLFDTGLRFAGLAEKAKEDPTVLDEIAAALAAIGAEENGLAFYPGFALSRFADELLGFARVSATEKEPAPQPRPKPSPSEEWEYDPRRGTTQAVTGFPGVRWVRQIWEGRMPRLVSLPALGGLRRGGKGGPESGHAKAPAIPPAQDTALLIRLGQDGAGQLVLSASVAAGTLAGGELRCTLDGRETRLSLSPEPPPDGATRWATAAVLPQPENPLAALSGLAMSLVGPGSSPGVLSVLLSREQGERMFQVTVTSYGTGIERARIECLVGGGRGTMAVPPEVRDHWQAGLTVDQPQGPPTLAFALWITG